MNKQATPISARAAAYLSLMRCRSEGRYANLELDTALRKFELQGAERALYTTLTYGVIERSITLDHLLGQVSERPLAALDPRVLCILRLGAYQLLFLDRIPDHAAVAESGELCRRYASPKAVPFVNAVLRNLLRRKAALTYPDPAKAPADYLSCFYGFPLWIARLYLTQYGFARAASLLEAQNQHPFLTLHTNTLRISREDLLARLQKEGVQAEVADAPNAIRLLQNVAIPDLTPLAEGLCFVQDLASQKAVAALEARPGDTVIDACACPGGKSFAIALQMQNCGALHSFDLHANKLSLVETGAKRLGITCLTTRRQDGATDCPQLWESADRILCDVPCSGLGVMAKKPDLRHKKEEEILRLPDIQYAILCNTARYLKPGGRLVYSTCTLHQAENESVARRFEKEHPDFSAREMHTLFPDTDGTDGFFYAVFVRNIG